MQLVQIRDERRGARLGLVIDDKVWDLTAGDPRAAESSRLLLGRAGTRARLVEQLRELSRAPGTEPTWSYRSLEDGTASDAVLLPPIDAPEVWAAGVTYERSREAREAESGAAAFYAKVYAADRPELFLKTSNMLRIVGPHAPIGIRHDSAWTVPEPELAVVLGRDAEIVGYTIGNDVTARDIEAANPLYLPQAKSFRGGCSLGPSILLAEDAVDPSDWTVEMRITRGDEVRFDGAVHLSSMRRSLSYLRDYLLMDNEVLPGTVLLTGTGIVPPDEFALEAGDVVSITIGPLGTLSNPVVRLASSAGEP